MMAPDERYAITIINYIHLEMVISACSEVQKKMVAEEKFILIKSQIKE